MHPISEAVGEKLTPVILGALLKGMGLRARLDRAFRAHLFQDVGNGREPWSAKVVFRTRDGSIVRHLIVRNGRVSSRKGPLADPDAVFVFKDAACLKKMLTAKSGEAMEMLLRNELSFEGNMCTVARVSYLIERLTAKQRPDTNPKHDFLYSSSLAPPRHPLRARKSDAVVHLDDPSLSHWTIDDFPRLQRFLTDFFATRPAISTERPRLLTEYFKRNGFEAAPDGSARDPVLRQGEAFKYLMENRKPIIRNGDLIAGTTTDKPIGVVIYPDLGGLLIWPELYTMHLRSLNPYTITEEDRQLLSSAIFPYWEKRNMREVARARAGNPECMRLDERFVLYFQWKAHSLSHTIPNFPAVLGKGLAAIANEARDLERGADDESRRNFYVAARLGCEGVIAYASHLSEEAARLAVIESDAVRRAELENLSTICAKVPARPAETLDEAVNAMWITWVGCHMENTNAGLSIGRVDKWLQPYFLTDMAKCADDEARHATIKRAVELVGCFFLRCTDHLPLVADLGNKLFGGSSSDQAITLGGVLEDGSTNVTDMTYIILKVAEMLRLRDPNLNARWHPEVNSVDYLRRLCEVNVLTGSTPSIHNDRAVIAAMVEQGFAVADARDWSATGCVEPTSSGRHFGHTNSMMFSMVAPLEMALRDGYHPLCGERIGPRTGAASTLDTFEKLYDAYRQQFRYVAERSVECNNLFGETHRFVRPTPFLSVLVDGCMEKGKDVVFGGAKYNSSGTAMIGLADVVDSLMAMKKLVYDEQRIDLPALVDALDRDFEGNAALHARISNKVPRFGSGDPETIAIAQDLINWVYDLYQSFPHYRGGRYTTGYWSMSNHVAFGTLSGALPSGRRRHKPFTPGITPAAGAKDSLLQNIRTVASLNPLKMPNNIAFNVKVVPDSYDTPEQTLDTMTAYAKTYLDSGGMQMQFNVVSTQTLREAMEHPELHRNLMVRISGYNAYFVELNRDLQLELIARTEHSL
jgi:pyruvate formate-lyase/glycerol dehydratase family glycyl radical enzyme